MNKRIKELALLAGAHVSTRNLMSNPVQHVESVELWDDKIEKFAELLVRECLQQCERIRDDAYTQKKSEYLTESGRLIYEGVFGGATNCGFAIQQHFGVEE